MNFGEMAVPVAAWFSGFIPGIDSGSDSVRLHRTPDQMCVIEVQNTPRRVLEVSTPRAASFQEWSGFPAIMRAEFPEHGDLFPDF